jgi:hypothetical protein
VVGDGPRVKIAIRSAPPEDAQRAAGGAPQGARIHADDAIRYVVEVFETVLTCMRDRIEATEDDEVTRGGCGPG